MKKLFKKIKKLLTTDYKLQTSYGFTLIEVMIASGLFVVVMILGVTAILNSNNLHKKSQNQRELLDTVYFILEDMTRNLRTGYDYHCGIVIGEVLSTPKSCPDGEYSIAFEPFNGLTSNDNDQVAYAFTDIDNDPNFLNIEKNIDGGINTTDYVKLNPDGLKFDKDKSGFTVFGAEGGNVDSLQPRVLIRFAGEIHYRNDVTKFNVQTTVTQRLIDN